MNSRYFEKKRLTILVIFIFILSIVLIGVGIYFNIISREKYIASKTIDKFSYYIKNYIDKNNTSLGDNFTVKSNIDFDLTSEYFQRESLASQEYAVLNNYLKNISNMNSEIIFSQDIKKKKAYFESNLNLPNENLLTYKKYINDSTEYYFIKDILNTYVNNGNCNYFESLNSENTSKENLIYLYDFVIESLKNNLDSNYFNKYIVEGKDNKENINQLSLKLDDSAIRKILKGILKDLKADEKANKILTGYFAGFKNFKIKDSTVFLEKDESYTINIYTTKFFNKFLKLEIVYMNGISKNIIDYEGDSFNGSISYINNDKLEFIIDCKFSDSEYDFIIKNNSSKKVGVLKIDNDLKRINLSLSWDEGDGKIDINYTSKYREESKNRIIKNKDLSFKSVGDKVTILDGDIHIVTELSNKVDIKEGVSNSILKSTLTNEEMEAIKNKTLNIFERLAR